MLKNEGDLSCGYFGRDYDINNAYIILFIKKCLYKNVVIRLNILLYAMKGLDDGDFDYF